MNFNKSIPGLSLGLLMLSCWFPLASAEQVVGTALGRNFTGITYGTYNTNSAALPPDCDGAVGPHHFVEFINGMFAVFTKFDGSLVEVKTDVDFWATAGVGVSGDWTVTDPRIIYDPASQRWFASQVDVDVFTQVLDNVLGTNHFLLAVSSTSDPTGPWKGLMFDSDPDNGNFADFPTLGFDSSGVYLSGDMFDSLGPPATAASIGPALVSFPKADLLANPPIFTNRTRFGAMTYATRGQVLQPAVCSDGSSSGAVLAAGDIGNTSSPHSNLVSFAVQNAAGPGAATLGSSVFLTVNPYMVPDNATAGAPLLTPMQPDGTSKLEANDARFAALVYGVNGVLYAAHSTELSNRIAIRWYRIRASDAVLLESGTLADTNLDLFFPSIAANSNGTVVIGCNGSSSNTYVSSFAFVGQTVNGVTTFGSPILLYSGTTSYHGDDEALAGQSRWGDYSATSVDPVDSSRFWTIQIVPVDVNVWSTQITELRAGPTLLAINRQNPGQLQIVWSTAAAGYQLQSTASLVPPAAWSNVTQNLVTNGYRISVVLPESLGAQFFRLKKL